MVSQSKVQILKDKSFYFPNDGSNLNVNTHRIIKVCNQLSNNLNAINQGGCGMFAVMLDSIFNGKIIRLIRVGKQIPSQKINDLGYETDFHEFFLKDGICYDAYQVCRIENLKRLKSVDEIISTKKFDRIIKPNRFYLIDRSPDKIINDYQNVIYNLTFANSYKMNILYANYANVLRLLPTKIKQQTDVEKINQITLNCHQVISSLAA